MTSSAVAIADVLTEVGHRSERVRTRRDVTLTELAAVTGLSKSALSRRESGSRTPSLELILPTIRLEPAP